MDMNLHHWLTLSFAPGITGHFIRSLADTQLQLSDLLQYSSAELRRLKLKESTINALTRPDLKKIEQHLAWEAQDNNNIITLGHPDYPPLLKEISDPPLLLYVTGNSKLLNAPQLAMVGSRRPTPMGKETAYKFARELSQAGLVITSGLAIGIDGASHRGALAAGMPTIAVQACGMDKIYPHIHRQLAQDIMDTGAVISEQPLGSEPQRTFFPARNRIVSGLSLGTLVVEAAKRSGSLITAYLAADQGRMVGAIPGSIHNPTSQGCHQLLTEGAALITSSNDILSELNMKNDCKSSKRVNLPNGGLENSHQKLLECVAFEATPLDLIYARSEMEMPQVCSQLLQLELQGLIQTIPGGYVRVNYE